MPSSPRSQKLWTWVRRSANVVGVVSESDEKTLISPLFSATKTRPSAAKRTTVGLVRPLNEVVSANPAGSVLAAAGPLRHAAALAASAIAIAKRNPRERIRPAPPPMAISGP